MCSGWYLAAFEGELRRELSSVWIGKRRVLLVRSAGKVQAFPAACPHRGADLGVSGALVGERVICGFHGHSIGLGDSGHGFGLTAYDAVSTAGLVFVRLKEGQGNGFRAAIKQLAAEHSIVPGFSLAVRAPPSLIIENAFDRAHFGPVHSVPETEGFTIVPQAEGAFCVESVFGVPVSPWQRGRAGERMVQVPLRACAYSPGVIISSMGGANPYTVITCATPTPDGGSLVRVALALPHSLSPEEVKVGSPYLLKQARLGIEKDRLVWENMLPIDSPRFTAADSVVTAFQEFCLAAHEAEG